MPLPEPREQEGKSVRAAQEPSPESPEPGTDVVPAAPTKPRKFSKLVLLTASKDSAKVAGAKRKGVHCIMSLGVPGPATLAKALLKIHPEAERAIEAAPQGPEQKRSKVDTDLSGLWGHTPHGNCGELEQSCPSSDGERARVMSQTVRLPEAGASGQSTTLSASLPV
nr:FLYWCH family member 2 isoform X1 [Manis javanica]XP_036880413.1 FLYWCH family member 2 isoform X1 [Manis javanica]XP_036880414.1 FLYWCH family member 2 isoform X1 [Manis javanica]XP_036880415.1 FLYWCH family member 2 isoform X1 [Manis javanica]